ncbi:MAG TPA: hypothetical protein VI729_12660, partial [Anaerolineales bacterium]|nr:hypothetical protein [Anaerolineales bacterium]
VIYREDVGMCGPRDRVELAPETTVRVGVLGEGRSQIHDDDSARDRWLVGQVERSYPAFADLPHDSILADRLAAGKVNANAPLYGREV